MSLYYDLKIICNFTLSSHVITDAGAGIAAIDIAAFPPGEGLVETVITSESDVPVAGFGVVVLTKQAITLSQIVVCG